MRREAGSLCLTATGGQDITPEERQQAVRSLRDSRRALLEAVRGLSDAQWRFRPGPGRWSAAEMVGNLARITAQIGRQILSRTEREGAAAAHLGNPEAVLDQYRESYAQIAEILTSAPNLREHVRNHPVFGPLDGYEWILLVATDTERHARRILELRKGAAGVGNAGAGQLQVQIAV